eukprot:CAMPEP_0168794874 /NCGR_PEP_ID=MMETSP0725-20121227/15876_1 /TAXON_ID=265536 /ORGANISM="Amphiprora sp., Strain CCMP467" /LENGTH=33 /DNA_ID= /DNA_START= /DNA_END= /DNA_ORIENTATION=
MPPRKATFPARKCVSVPDAAGKTMAHKDVASAS